MWLLYRLGPVSGIDIWTELEQPSWPQVHILSTAEYYISAILCNVVSTVFNRMQLYVLLFFNKCTWSFVTNLVFYDSLQDNNTQNMCGNGFNQDCKALQRVVCLAERISGSALPSLQDIYLKRCKSRVAKIIKDSNHPGNRLFIILQSGKRFRSMMAKTERLRKSFFPQAIRLLNSKSVS